MKTLTHDWELHQGAAVDELIPVSGLPTTGVGVRCHLRDTDGGDPSRCAKRLYPEAFPAYHARAVALRDWSSAVWTYLDGVAADVMAGNRAPPTDAQLMAELPQPPMTV